MQKRYLTRLWLLVLSLLMASCGFHLRGTGKAELPPAFATMRVLVQGSQMTNDPLLLAMQDVLRTQAGVRVVDAPDAPTLVLSDERIETQVLSVRETGKASEYLLKYTVQFKVVDEKGLDLAPAQTLRLQRDYTFDPLRVLAKEKEEHELRRELQRDAVQQILRRLARIK